MDSMSPHVFGTIFYNVNAEIDNKVRWRKVHRESRFKRVTLTFQIIIRVDFLSACMQRAYYDT